MGKGDIMNIIYSTTNVYGLHILQVLSIVPGHGAVDVGINSKQIKLNTRHSIVALKSWLL